MKTVTVVVEDFLYEFYQKVGMTAGGLSPEKVMADMLFRAAGEISADMLRKETKKLKTAPRKRRSFHDYSSITPAS